MQVLSHFLSSFNPLKTETAIHFINENRFEDIVHKRDTNEVVLSDISRDYEGIIPNVKGILFISQGYNKNIESGIFFEIE